MLHAKLFLLAIFANSGGRLGLSNSVAMCYEHSPFENGGAAGVTITTISPLGTIPCREWWRDWIIHRPLHNAQLAPTGSGVAHSWGGDC